MVNSKMAKAKLMGYSHEFFMYMARHMLLIQYINEVATLHDIEMHKAWVVGRVGCVYINAVS